LGHEIVNNPKEICMHPTVRLQYLHRRIELVKQPWPVSEFCGLAGAWRSWDAELSGYILANRLGFAARGTVRLTRR